jgi:hypothetical protein
VQLHRQFPRRHVYSSPRFRSAFVDLTAARISQQLILTRAKFWQETKLYDTVTRMLVMKGRNLPDDFPFKGDAVLDLRGCTFELFVVSDTDNEAVLEKQARSLAEAQDPSKFSRDPYIQLEKYYEK